MALHNLQQTMASLNQLRSQTQQALLDGYYPLIVGGDSSLVIATIQAMKNHSPNSKILIFDSQMTKASDLTLEQQELDKLALSLLSGQVPIFEHLSCLQPENDVCILGNQQQGDFAAPYISPKNYKSDKINKSIETLESQLNEHFDIEGSDLRNFWLSINATAFDSTQFGSYLIDSDGQKDGLSLEFVTKMIEKLSSKSYGMDLSEINLESTIGMRRQTDESTLRELIELVHHQVNKDSNLEIPSYSSSQSQNLLK